MKILFPLFHQKNKKSIEGGCCKTLVGINAQLDNASLSHRASSSIFYELFFEQENTLPSLLAKSLNLYHFC